ncbi:DNA repair protein RAD57 [Podospora conica]|nr:DNA repair protein RAD57 [Schizothecium conicum]
MSDLTTILPGFDVRPYLSLIPSLERHQVTTAELVTVDAVLIAKRSRLPILNVKRLCADVLNALQHDPARQAELQARQDARRQSQEPPTLGNAPSRITVASLIAESRVITTLDPALDHALAGGIPAGQVTEITGESGTGKTQFVHGLLLAVQLPPPYGLGKPALYITTEAPLSTRRLTQVSNSNPFLQSIDEASKPSMDRIHTTATPFGDLEQQDFMISYQVPAAIERLGIGLIVIDSVTANFRAEFERNEGESQGRKMGRRAKALIRLGWHLRTLANRHNIAIVVVNQVADRFERENSVAQASCSTYWPLDPSYSGPAPHPAVQRFVSSHSRPDPSPPEATQSSQTMSSTDRNPYAYIPPPMSGSGSRPRLGKPLPGENYSHQLRWITGWGDERNQAYPPKTPALGMIWTNLVAMRLAFIKQPIYSASHEETSEQALVRHGRSIIKANSWRRWMKIVFATHVPPSAPGLKGAVEFEVTTGGLKALGSGDGEGE